LTLVEVDIFGSVGGKYPSRLPHPLRLRNNLKENGLEVNKLHWRKPNKANKVSKKKKKKNENILS